MSNIKALKGCIRIAKIYQDKVRPEIEKYAREQGPLKVMGPDWQTVILELNLIQRCVPDLEDVVRRMDEGEYINWTDVYSAVDNLGEKMTNINSWCKERGIAI